MSLFATFFEFTPEHITATLNYTKEFIADITPLLLPIIAIGLGLIIFWAIISAIKK